MPLVGTHPCFSDMGVEIEVREGLPEVDKPIHQCQVQVVISIGVGLWGRGEEKKGE